jgi:hypothetical protein
LRRWKRSWSVAALAVTDIPHIIPRPIAIMDTALEALGGTHITIEVVRKDERFEWILGQLYDLVSRPTETGRSKVKGSDPRPLRMQMCKRN